MVTLRQLEFALAVSKHRHFKRAAEECNISQSALSLGIAELEKQLNTQIFERNNKHVLITPISEAILDRAKSIFIEISDLTALVNSHRTPLTYPMTIGIIPTIAPFLLPKALPILNQQYPNFQIQIIENQTERLIEKVRYGSIDTAIIALPYPTEGLHVFEFWEEDFFAFFTDDKPESKLDTISSKQLSQTNLLLLGEGHCLTDQVLLVCSFDKDELSPVFTEASLNTIIQMSVNGMGTTLVPEMALDQLCCQHPHIKTVRIAEPSPHRRIAFISRLNYARVNDIRLLSDMFRQALTNNPTSDEQSRQRINAQQVTQRQIT